VAAFGWPLLTQPGSTLDAHATDAPWVLTVVLGLLLAAVGALTLESRGGSGVGIDAKGIALLGVLTAVIMALRPLGAGTLGLEPIWVVLILAGRALGPGFGVCLGALSLFASALITGGVGPWLPFQMVAAAWVGLGAGLLPRVTGRAEIALLAAYGAIASLAYGLLLNLWLWPFLTGLPEAIAFVPGAGPAVNLSHWLAFSLATSPVFDIPRAVLTVVLTVLLGRPVLNALHRASRRAAFGARPVFEVAP
jgi:energy-coupling factor transport system substrate-specific component